MSAKYKISRSYSGQYVVVKNEETSSNVTDSGLRQLCHTVGKPYHRLIAELDHKEVVELTVVYGKIQTL